MYEIFPNNIPNCVCIQYIVLIDYTLIKYRAADERVGCS
jgi:hypothetical protein